ncbi:metaxin-2-like [Varroa jacobsoni]|uniref:metaxin-2-like n=1 Tax=Varroa jacobsoni TaxID=62625 RepID=UPI000BF6E4F7|nr:metaxin-2-like [Varroa jacobsoni]
MRSTLVQEAWAIEVGSREPWADNAKIYQPIEKSQAQSNERAQSLAVQCFLRVCGLRHDVIQRVNAEFISPTGTTPVLQCGSFVIAELESIVVFVASKGITKTNDLSQEENADLKAYFSLVQTVLCSAELYFSWISATGYNVTYNRYGSVYPWPLNGVLPWKKRRAIKKLLQDWSEKNEVEVIEEVESCLTALSDRLSDKMYFFGVQPTELDCLVFGHLFILLNPGPEAAPEFRQIAPLVKKFSNLVQFCDNIEAKYFQKQLQM